jgi:hypothetical protein
MHRAINQCVHAHVHTHVSIQPRTLPPFHPSTLHTHTHHTMADSFNDRAFEQSTHGQGSVLYQTILALVGELCKADPNRVVVAALTSAANMLVDAVEPAIEFVAFPGSSSSIPSRVHPMVASMANAIISTLHVDCSLPSAQSGVSGPACSTSTSTSISSMHESGRASSKTSAYSMSMRDLVHMRPHVREQARVAARVWDRHGDSMRKVTDARAAEWLQIATATNRLELRNSHSRLNANANANANAHSHARN